MPSSLFADRSVQGDALDEQRALQIALDQLSLLGLSHDDDDDSREPRRKNVNMTECVPVPSSEHVAEIVGRQGCKIKALRAKTNTYIKTPVRGEEPVFVVTGRREDVAMARREIISAAEHFSLIRASRNKNTSLNGSGTPVPSPPNLPGQTTIQVRVPYRVVGLVVGPKGTTIKRIQQQTHTYIVTPSRDKEPVFDVTGMPENVDRAREEIEAHIAVRTGGLIEVQDVNDFHDNGTDVGFDLNGHPNLWSKPSAGMTPSSVCKTFYKYRNDSSSSLGSASTDSYFGTNSHMADYSPPSPALSYTANSINCNINNNNNISVNTKSNGFVYGNEAISPDCTDLTSDSPPGFEPMPAQPAILWSLYENENNPPLTRGSSSTYTTSIYPDNSNGMLINQRRTNGDGSQCRMSPTLHTGPNQHQMAPRVCSDLSEDLLNFSGYVNSVASLTHSHLACIPCDSSASSSSSSSSTSRKGSRDCSVCFESEVIAALVPCGHNLFCMDCANRICERSEPKCPVCHTSVTQAIRIFS
ncbi:RNA-binding protein MEX3B isoform X1 [Syngnathoides biaculeatus]|uniref:RNA-binding protein MEX3B isoform X1 n=1 Tax=Syngnathoides biaculeatus TaxID=300417 RepID=UPI002ADE6D3C|nr:RNA-binding protein MEX3B isoform X1 [Syngnathoides biaculeatus]